MNLQILTFVPDAAALERMGQRRKEHPGQNGTMPACPHTVSGSSAGARKLARPCRFQGFEPGVGPRPTVQWRTPWYRAQQGCTWQGTRRAAWRSRGPHLPQAQYSGLRTLVLRGRGAGGSGRVHQYCTVAPVTHGCHPNILLRERSKRKLLAKKDKSWKVIQRKG